MVVAAFLVFLLVATAGTHQATATTYYCLCNFGLNATTLDKNIDFACRNGADCASISRGGVCYIPDTLVDHCNYAVNSYFIRSQAPDSCDYNGTAILTERPPFGTAPGCVYSGVRDTSDYSEANSTTPLVLQSRLVASFLCFVFSFF